jgi:anti-anti-sigma factor
VADSGILNLVSIDRDGCVRLASNGPITANGAIAANGTHFLSKNPLETLLGVTWFSNRVIVDFSRTDFIDSAAIGWLIGTAREFRVRGGRFAIHSVTPRVRQMLNILKIGQLVPLLTDEEAARRFVTEGTATLVPVGA